MSLNVGLQVTARRRQPSAGSSMNEAQESLTPFNNAGMAAPPASTNKTDPAITILSLPSEILYQILLFLRPPINHSVKPTAMLPVALTCSQLYRVVRPLIWSIVRTVDEDENLLFFSTLAALTSSTSGTTNVPLNNPVHLIKRIRYFLPPPPNLYLPVIFSFHFTLTAFTIGSCDAWNPFPTVLTNFISSQSQTLRDLRTYGFLHPFEDQSFTLSGSLPHLKELAIANSEPDCDQVARVFGGLQGLDVLRVYPEQGWPEFCTQMVGGYLGTVSTLLLMSREPEEVMPPILPAGFARELKKIGESLPKGEYLAPHLKLLVIDNFNVFPVDGIGGALPLLQTLAKYAPPDGGLYHLKLRFFESLLDLESDCCKHWQKFRMPSVRVLGLQAPATYFTLQAMQAVAYLVFAFPRLQRLHLIQWEDPSITTVSLATLTDAQFAFTHAALWGFLTVLEGLTEVMEFVYEDLCFVRESTGEKFMRKVVWRDIDSIINQHDDLIDDV